MAQGKQVRLYLVDGTPGGLLTAEIMNWTGHVVAAPRSSLASLLARDEARRTGVYLLLGDDTDGDSPGGRAVYVGEGDDISSRLRQHAKPATAGGKDFWDRVVILTSKDSNLTKAHARYIESRLIALAATAQRSRVMNGTAPVPIQLPEADVADMEYYLSQVEIVLPVLSVTEFRTSRSRGASDATGVTIRPESPVFRFSVARHGLSASAQEIDGEFTVLQGSIARAAWLGASEHHVGYRELHERLLADGSLTPTHGGQATFTRDVVVSSPSAAAAVVAGRAANGRTAWVDPESGIDFGTWQTRGVGLA